MTALREITLGSYLDNVSSSSPAPGGGSVAAVTGALSASLGCMVTALSSRRSADDQVDGLAKACSQFRESFLQLSADDQAAFEAVMSALKLPKEDASRAQRVEQTVQAAAEVPLTIAQACVNLLDVLETLLPMASRHCISDVGAAAHLALASLRASLLNVTINITFMKDRAAADRYEATALRLEHDAQQRCQRIVDQVAATIRH